jgi:hypothetical protein
LAVCRRSSAIQAHDWSQNNRWIYGTRSSRRSRISAAWAVGLTVINAREKGGIAKPAVFILSPDLTVRFVSVDQVASCVPAAEILRLLREGGQGAADNRKGIVARARNVLRRDTECLAAGRHARPE